MWTFSKEVVDFQKEKNKQMNALKLKALRTISNVSVGDSSD